MLGRFVRRTCGVDEGIGMFRLELKYSENWRDRLHEELAPDCNMSFELNLSRGKRFLTRTQLDRLCCAGTGIGLQITLQFVAHYNVAVQAIQPSKVTTWRFDLSL